jgi:hypothetical protein
MNADIPFFVRCGAAAGMNNFLKIRNELRKKRTILALGGSVTRRRFTEPARAAVGFMRRPTGRLRTGGAAGMGACPVLKIAHQVPGTSEVPGTWVSQR